MSGVHLGGCYVTAPSNVIEMYQQFCLLRCLSFTVNDSVLSPDPSTLFTTSGMQKHKPTFLSPTVSKTITDVQHCLRLNDLDEIGDGTHYLDFYMLGLFSFNDWTVQQGVDFWMDFCSFIGVIPDTVTIHPDCPQWRGLYDKYPVKVTFDPECKWSDGSIGGYCTEFYKDGVEIGNIVNPLGTHLDCGFGMERLQSFCSNMEPPTSERVLFRTIEVLLNSGVVPGNSQQGYVLRKLIRKGIDGCLPSHELVEKERRRVERIRKDVPRLLKKHPNSSPEFFWETYGISQDDLNM